jgi:hypothetical protein
MNKLVFGLAALPFFLRIAAAAEPLTDVQMDEITAGDLPAITCTSCISSSSTATSMTTNGITVTTSVGSTTGGNDGSTGNSGGSTGNNGGSTGNNGGSIGGTTPAPVPTVTLPANLVSIITAATGFGPVLH